jgi:hypothetical protein
MNKKNSFWSTVEVMAAASDFNYDEYVNLMKHLGDGPLCESAYAHIVHAFNLQLEHDIGD